MLKRNTWIWIIVAAFLGDCASLSTPSGGPKDKTAPKLLSSIPSNKQTLYSGKIIQLTFDEDIKLVNPKEEIIISPSVGKNIDITAKGNLVTIKPENPWLPDITYSIQFREGIQDLNEGNIPPNLKLAFSTGSIIDSLHISGRVTDLLKGTPADKVTVAIYPSDTFNIFTDTPSYFSMTNKRGQYLIENLHVGEYYLYAFIDNNKNLKVDSKGESHGFLSEKIILKNNLDSIPIALFRLDSRKLRLISAKNNGLKTIVRLTKSAVTYSLESTLPIDHSFGDDQAEISVYGAPPLADSTLVKLKATDSLQTTLDTTFYIKQNPQKSSPEKLKWTFGQPAIDSESGNFNAAIQTSKLVSTINPDSLYIRLDSATTIPLTKQNFTIDLLHRKINVQKTVDPQLIKGKDIEQPTLHAGRSLFITFEQDTSKTNETKINILSSETGGTLLVETNTKKEHFVIQLITNGQVVQSARNVSRHIFKNVTPGEYQIRTIIDSNNNGEWDPGNFFKRREPENIIYYRNASGQPKIPVRANWELGPLKLTF